MKLIEGVSTEMRGEEALLPNMPSTAEYFAVFTGAAAEKFPQPIPINEITYFVFNELKEEKSEEDLVKAMVENYEVEEAIAKEDIHALIESLKRAGIVAG